MGLRGALQCGAITDGERVFGAHREIVRIPVDPISMVCSNKRVAGETTEYSNARGA